MEPWLYSVRDLYIHSADLKQEVGSQHQCYTEFCGGIVVICLYPLFHCYQSTNIIALYQTHSNNEFKSTHLTKSFSNPYKYRIT